MMQNNKKCTSGIAKKGCVVLFAKRPGSTSFSSLFTIKHSLKTKKVGHTGTLDSFASGLLVVCVGPLTRLASRITEFDKTYEAIIKFGTETDTLEWTGNVIKTTQLPSFDDVEKAINSFVGNSMQKPPVFSAIRLDGKRASDLVREGENVEIPRRPITVYSAEILDKELTDDNKVSIVKVRFSVSKGTYIRSLARDIGEACNSSAHLIGLLRTSVGKFNLEDAVGVNLLEEFTIENAKKQITEISPVIEKTPQVCDSELEKQLEDEVQQKVVYMNENLAEQCGFYSVTIKDEYVNDFLNGKPIRFCFSSQLKSFLQSEYTLSAVFSETKTFLGLISKNESNKFRYSFVISTLDL
ncbi:MAG: tRNA pseudouridine(55) synthase TruB [Treponema sp.]|nr:tRNA pseudouridine(55) synthase TruB [Treponema sp.]